MKKPKKKPVRTKSKAKPQPDIRIIVAGGTAKGKSTILQIIAQALVEKGLALQVRSNPGDYDSPIAVEEFQNQRVMAVQGKKPLIVLEERATYRSLLRDSPDNIFGVKA